MWTVTCDPEPPVRNHPSFVEISAEVGINFSNDRPVTTDHFMPEAIGPGGALLDYDNDGDLDIYLVNGLRSVDGELETSEGSNRLFRQESPDRFTDVTDATGVGHTGYGMGAAVGDIDNDGFVDLYVTNYGADALFHNGGGRAFTDITDNAGITGSAWGASAGFFDYDSDGFLDLFVTRYVDYDPAVAAVDDAGLPEYPSPSSFPGLHDRLYRNLGTGSFTDVSDQVGLTAKAGHGLGVVFTDLNGDGRVDVYVANDGDPNFAWINSASGRFTERAQFLGLAVNVYGQPEAGMGIALGDYDLNGTMDLLVTHLVQESNTLYRQTARGLFEDGTAGSGLGTSSINHTGFGAAFVDLDQDGDLDLLTANGRVFRALPNPDASVGAHWQPYAENNQLFLNDGSGRFHKAGQDGAEFTTPVEVSRGLALGDLDNDGDLDFLVTNGNGTVQVYRNVFPAAGNWLSVRAIVPALHRDAFGAMVTVETATRTLQRPVTATMSYLSSSDPRAHFGLGTDPHAESIRVLWPDGTHEVFPGSPSNRQVVVRQGEGEVRP